MNLHGIVAPLIGVVNPNVGITISMSTGFIIQPDGIRVPTYTPISATAQIQALTFRDITQVQGLNLQGTRRAIYLYGNIEGLVRPLGQGGDKITFGNDGTMWANSVWLVVMTLETWPDWCKCACTLQVNP